ncbi:3'(2'),5'-bisphosphate nucleotidase CysQ [Sphingobacterium sp. LRF_L2]|uniref:3'(2'),5'-bisphosphate nucleotidase CysQ n=1 Tax=Sphingobacterium sp. LRF_L2 TaxID=3369421 RepID=UPI003F63C434
MKQNSTILESLLLHLDEILDVAIRAGHVILDVYQKDEEDWKVEWKSDQSPLTKADCLAHEVIAKGLTNLFPDIPILSEEGRTIPYEDRKDWSVYWCVDPLDGTKEFLARNGEFTVNIALMVAGVPIFGVIYAPVLDVLYFGGAQLGSFKQEGGSRIAIAVNPDRVPAVAVGSRSHRSPEEDLFLQKYGIKDVRSVGSSLKFCCIAAGEATLYYRHGPTMEWDIAAGHAIVKYSGGDITQIDGSPMVYNKPELVNPSFVCLPLA